MDFKKCFMCDCACESHEIYEDLIRCPDCQRESENMEDESRIRWMNGTDRERELA